jgi:hypothetical protein
VTLPERQGFERDGFYIDPHTKAWCTLPWPGERTLPYSHPDRVKLLKPSLAPGCFEWARENLVHYLTGEPWEFTNGQKRFLMLWYAVDIETGRFEWRRGMKRGSKGTGKDPLCAVWLLLELLGPTQLYDIDRGQVYGQPHRMPLVQIASNSEAQSKDVLRIANAMIPRETRLAYAVDAGETRTLLQDSGGRMEVLTSSEASTEGDPSTAGGVNESHHMHANNGGHALFRTIRRNVGKSPKDLQARIIEFTNGFEEGGDSVAERTHQAWQAQVAGKARGKSDILMDSISALPGTDVYDLDSLRAGLRSAYSDAPWADLERLEDEVLDPDLSVSEALRFYLNLEAANEEAWVEPRKFDAMADATVVLADGDAVALFLDCSKSSDATALMGCRITDGHVFTLGVWSKPPGDKGKGWRVPRYHREAQEMPYGTVAVDDVVRQAFSSYRVQWFGMDISPATEDTSDATYWGPLADDYHRDFGRQLPLWATPGARPARGRSRSTAPTHGHAVKFDMRLSQPGGVERNRYFVEMAIQTADDIESTTEAFRVFTHDGDSTLKNHVHHARRYPTQWGVSLGKASRDSKNLVDAAVAMVGARLGRNLVLNSGKTYTRVKKKARAVVYR